MKSLFYPSPQYHIGLLTQYLIYSCFLRLFFHDITLPSFVSPNLNLFRLRRLSLSSFSLLDHNLRIFSSPDATLSLGKNSKIMAYSTLHLVSNSQQSAFLKIGHNTCIGAFSSLGCAGGITIGNNVIAGEGLYIHSENHQFNDLSMPIKEQGLTHLGVCIEDNCWIGSRVTILDGVHIGYGTVVGAGSIVTRSFKPNTVLAGNPARPIKSR